MTVSNHTVLYRFTFPETTTTANTTLDPHTLIELSDLPKTRSKANITVYPESGRITGGGRVSPSFGSGTYRSYFCLGFLGAKVEDTGT